MNIIEAATVSATSNWILNAFGKGHPPCKGGQPGADVDGMGWKAPRTRRCEREAGLKTVCLGESPPLGFDPGKVGTGRRRCFISLTRVRRLTAQVLFRLHKRQTVCKYMEKTGYFALIECRAEYPVCLVQRIVKKPQTFERFLYVPYRIAKHPPNLPKQSSWE